MEYYKDENNQVYAYGEHVTNVQEGLTKITESEAKELSNPQKTDVELLAECFQKRSIAYKNESDPLRNEIEFDALANGVEPNFAPWVEKVQEIKERYPKP